MELMDLYVAHPFWWWVCASVALLAIEVATGAEAFLWPSMAAGTIAVLVGAGVHLPIGVDVAIFAVLTVLAMAAARRFRLQAEDKAADPQSRLVGVKGAVVSKFDRGAGRVLVEGAEWAAELEDTAQNLLPGDRIVVAKVLDGGRLQVRPA